MSELPSRIPVDRDLSGDERAFVRWLLLHGDRDNTRFLAQLDEARVVALCACGCASVDLAIAGERSTEPGIEVLADFQWMTAEGHACGAFVFAQGDLLGGLDLWSIDGQSIPSILPPISDLVPYGTLREP